MNKLFFRLACLAAFCLATSAQAALLTFNSPEQITFEDVPPKTIATYPEGGFRITGDATSDIPYLLLFNIGADGSQGLLVSADMPITLMAAGGGPFSLLGLEYAAFDLFGSGFDPTANLLVSGLVDGGNMLKRTLLLDSLDFASSSFQGWTNLTQVSFVSSADFVLDNINAVQQQSVPEPASLALISVALASLALGRRRNKRTAAQSAN